TLSAAALDNTLSVKCCPRPLSSNFNPYPWRAWSWKTVPQSFSTTSAASSATLNDAAEQSDPDICSTSSKGRKRDPLLPRRPRNPLPRRLPHRTPRMARRRCPRHRPAIWDGLYRVWGPQGRASPRTGGPPDRTGRQPRRAGRGSSAMGESARPRLRAVVHCPPAPHPASPHLGQVRQRPRHGCPRPPLGAVIRGDLRTRQGLLWPPRKLSA